MVLLLAASTAMLLRLVPIVEVHAASQAGLMMLALCRAASIPGSTFTATVLPSPPHWGPLMVFTKAAASFCFICTQEKHISATWLVTWLIRMQYLRQQLLVAEY